MTRQQKRTGCTVCRKHLTAMWATRLVFERRRYLTDHGSVMRVRELLRSLRWVRRVDFGRADALMWIRTTPPPVTRYQRMEMRLALMQGPPELFALDLPDSRVVYG